MMIRSFYRIKTVVVLAAIAALLLLAQAVYAISAPSEAVLNLSEFPTFSTDEPVGNASGSNYSNNPKVIKDSSGAIASVWMEQCNHSGVKDCLYYWNNADVDAAINLSRASSVTGNAPSTTSTMDQHKFNMVGDGSGTFGTVFQQADATDDDVYFWSSASPSSLINLSEVSTFTGTATGGGVEQTFEPVIVSTATGVFAVAWAESDGTDTDIYYWISSSSTAATNLSEISTIADSKNAITAGDPLDLSADVDASGNVAVVWAEDETSNEDVYYWNSSAASTLRNLSEATANINTPTGTAINVQVRFDPSNTAVVAWAEQEVSSAYDLYYWKSTDTANSINLSIPTTTTGIGASGSVSAQTSLYKNDENFQITFEGSDHAVSWLEREAGASAFNHGAYYWNSSTPTNAINISDAATVSGTAPTYNTGGGLIAVGDGTDTGVFFTAEDGTDKDVYYWNSSSTTNLTNLSEITSTGTNPSGDASWNSHELMSAAINSNGKFLFAWEEGFDLHFWDSTTLTSLKNLSEVSNKITGGTDSWGTAEGKPVVVADGLNPVIGALSGGGPDFWIYKRSAVVSATIEQAATQADPTNQNTVKYTVTFSDAIDPASFTTADVYTSQTGTSVSTVTEVAPSDGTTFQVVVSVTQDTTVTLNMSEGKVEGASDNSVLNLNSTSTDNAVTRDTGTPCGDAPAGYNVIVSNAAVIVGTDGKDFFCGGGGDNIMKGKGGVDIMYGNGGNDTILGGSQKDFIYGGGGHDVIKGDDGNDYIEGGGGKDTIFGLLGNDVIKGGDSVDTLKGGDGNDVIKGDDGKDFLYGQKHSDILIGGADTDKLYGGSNDDILKGGGSKDFLYGDGGKDKLLGGSGNDVLVGGTGNDILKGGGQAGDKLKQ